MKILILSTGERDGAGRATCRLYEGLRNLGSEVQIMIQHKLSNDPTILGPQTNLGKVVEKLNLNYRLDSLPLSLYSRSSHSPISLQWLPSGILNRIVEHDPDIINLHWICQGYLSIEAIGKLKQPIVLTLHDMWAFTGGCHYNETCDLYQKSCGTCPQLNSDRDWDLSRWVWQRKAKAWKNKNLTIAVPSRWMAKCAESSSLLKNLRIELIPNGIDINKFKPIDKILARQILNLPLDQQLVFFGSSLGASDPRKGFHLLEPALKKLSTSGWKDRFDIVIFGAPLLDDISEICGFRYHSLGTLTDEILMAILYSAADVVVAPSVQDNLPNIVMEALACGTPCVAFSIGGLPDLIEHQKNGYLAQPFNIDDLAQGIVWVLENQSRHQKLCYYSREKVEREFSLDLQAKRYQSLFSEIKITSEN